MGDAAGVGGHKELKPRSLPNHEWCWFLCCVHSRDAASVPQLKTLLCPQESPSSAAPTTDLVLSSSVQQETPSGLKLVCGDGCLSTHHLCVWHPARLGVHPALAVRAGRSVITTDLLQAGDGTKHLEFYHIHALVSGLWWPGLTWRYCRPVLLGVECFLLLTVE